jgi:hypothetical protein
LFPLFANSVLDTGEKFSSGVVDTRCILPPVENLPLLSTTPVVLVAEFFTSVVDTGGKFSTTVVVTMVHLHLQISLQI